MDCALYYAVPFLRWVQPNFWEIPWIQHFFSGKSCTSVSKVPLIEDTLRVPRSKSPPLLSTIYGYLATMGNDRFLDRIHWLHRSVINNNTKCPFENITYLLDTYTGFLVRATQTAHKIVLYDWLNVVSILFKKIRQHAKHIPTLNPPQCKVMRRK